MQPSGEGRGEGGRNSTNGHHATSARATYLENHFAARDRQVADVTGAGDTVLAVLGTALARGIDLASACELATAAAGLQVERLGVAPIFWHELPSKSGGALPPLPPGEGRGEGGPNAGKGQPAPSDPDSSLVDTLQVIPPQCSCRASGLRSPLARQAEPAPPGAKILPLAELSALIRSPDRSTRTIVFSNGCFDLLHAGHVHCLTAAQALGDVLVVAVNSDASVRRLKGPSRPIVSERDRAALLAALACVDYVVMFDDDTPERLIAELRPDVLVKGAEPRPDPIPGESLVASYGGRLELIPPLPGISTTALLERVLPPLPPGEGRGEGGWNHEQLPTPLTAGT